MKLSLILCVIAPGMGGTGVALGHTVMATRHPSFCSGGCLTSYLLGVIIKAVSEVAD